MQQNSPHGATSQRSATHLSARGARNSSQSSATNPSARNLKIPREILKNFGRRARAPQRQLCAQKNFSDPAHPHAHLHPRARRRFAPCFLRSARNIKIRAILKFKPDLERFLRALPHSGARKPAFLQKTPNVKNIDKAPKNCSAFSFNHFLDRQSLWQNPHTDPRN